MTDELGDLVPVGESVALQFTRHYPHSPTKVWRAVAQPEHQAMWFPQQILGERRPGASLRFVTSVDPDDGFDGAMIEYDPPRLIEMMWGESRLRIELEPDGSGTRLVLTEWLDDVGKGARNGAGWHECLDRLTAIVSDTTPLRWGVRWREIHPLYVERFGPDANLHKAPDNWDDGLPDVATIIRFGLMKWWVFAPKHAGPVLRPEPLDTAAGPVELAK